MRIVALLLAVTLMSLSLNAFVEPDWPQWRGPDRTGVSTETGLLKAWPPAGPTVVWSVAGLGEGYGTVAIKENRIYVQGTYENRSVVFCLNRDDGQRLWMRELSAKPFQDRGSGPRGTPTIDGDRAYVLAEEGELACLRTKDGSVVWRLNILHEFKGHNPHWHISESPLVDGNRLIVTPGGPNAGIIALDKMSGKTVWTSQELSDPAGYSSCLVRDVLGVRTIMTLTGRAGVGIRATDGKLMWRYEGVSNRTANITTPIFHDNKVFYTSAYGTGCALLRLKANNGQIEAEEVYFNKVMQNHHGGVVLVKGHLYGFSASILTCMEFETGKEVWKDRSVGKGSLTFADGLLYLLSENNVVGLAEANPEGYKEKGRFPIADQGRPSWAHPVVSAGRLYIRNQGMLTCYDIKAPNN